MLTLLTPSALLALLGLLVPVAIHLWNRRPGREVAVGSLRWLTAGANRRLRSLQPEQLWLLLLRLALLTVLALAAAGPGWKKALPPGRGQVLLSPEAAGSPALAALRLHIDSLRRRGYALRWLAPGFPKVSASAWTAAPRQLQDSARTLQLSQPAASAFYWSRVQQAAGRFSSQPLYVLAPAALRAVPGSHPPLPARVTWQLLPTAVAKTWLQAATRANDSLRLLLGYSTETLTSFKPVTVAAPQPGQPVVAAGLEPLRLVEGKNGARLLPLNPAKMPLANQPAIPLHSRAIRVLIYHTADFAPDARYLQAGLRAAATGLPLPLDLRLSRTAPSPAAAPPDWLLWLSDAPLPGAWLPAVKAGLQVWQPAPAPGVAAPTLALPGLAGGKPLRIFRRGSPLPLPGTVGHILWADGQGRPLLTRYSLGAGEIYQLHTRLHPAWSELAESPALPAQLLQLLQPAPEDDNARPATALNEGLAANDQRALDPAQLLPAGQQAAAFTAPAAFHTTDLRPWLVLAAGLLFAFERWLARRRETLTLPSAHE